MDGVSHMILSFTSFKGRKQTRNMAKNEVNVISSSAMSSAHRKFNKIYASSLVVKMGFNYSVQNISQFYIVLKCKQQFNITIVSCLEHKVLAGLYYKRIYI